MHFKVTYTTWLVATLFISQTICDDKASGDGHGASNHGSGGGGGGHEGGSGGGSGGGSAGGHGGGSGGGHGGGSGGGSGGVAIGMGNMSFGMNGMSGIQLPFPFFPPFGCDTICQPIQLQVFQQQQVQEMVTKPTPTTQAPTTHPPTTMPPPRSSTQVQRPSPTSTTYTSQTIIMYPNWCQGWCKFFYQPPPQPVYYQPNCLLFSWMGLGSGMAMGMPTTAHS
uniref:Uncharacterized protein n=1 Tax=Schizaphis graminum TaxID=13262 RepID=A0A2S2NNM5_SCHGA